MNSTLLTASIGNQCFAHCVVKHNVSPSRSTASRSTESKEKLNRVHNKRRICSVGSSHLFSARIANLFSKPKNAPLLSVTKEAGRFYFINARIPLSRDVHSFFIQQHDRRVRRVRSFRLIHKKTVRMDLAILHRVRQFQRFKRHRFILTHLKDERLVTFPIG